MIGWAIVLGYVLLGLGTARWAFSVGYVETLEERRERFPSMSLERAQAEARTDAFVLWATALAGLFWPTVALFVLVFNPLGRGVRAVCRAVFPLISRWFMAPAHRRAEKAGVAS